MCPSEDLVDEIIQRRRRAEEEGENEETRDADGAMDDHQSIC